MSVAATHLATARDETPAASFATASIAPSANQLVLAAVFTTVSGGATAAPTLSGNGLTWVQIATQVFSTDFRITLFRAMGSSPSSGAVTMDFSANTQDFGSWSLTEFNNVDTSGANGAGAVVQSAINSDTTAVSLTMTLSAFAEANNATYGTVGISINEAPGAGSGFSLLGTTAGGQGSLGSEWRSDNDTSVNMTFSSANCGGIAVEIQVAALVGSGPLYY